MLFKKRNIGESFGEGLMFGSKMKFGTLNMDFRFSNI